MFSVRTCAERCVAVGAAGALSARQVSERLALWRYHVQGSGYVCIAVLLKLTRKSLIAKQTSKQRTQRAFYFPSSNEFRNTVGPAQSMAAIHESGGI
jgi:hypothetical protein